MEADQNSWASASSQGSFWSRDDDSLSFESLSVTSLQCVEPAHSILTDGLQSAQQYNHPTIIRDVTVNHFNNCLYLLDDSGIVRWSHGNHRSSRVFQFPPYKHKLLSTIIYSDYYNVYFVLTTSGKVKVLNKDFSEVHTLELPVEQSKVSCIAFNHSNHQLVTGGLGGIKTFNYCPQQVNWKVIKPMAQYSLLVDHVSHYTEGVWIRRVNVSTTMDWLIGMSGCDVLIYTFNASLLLHLKRLHQGHVTCCVFIPLVNYYITASEDASIKVWSQSGALITTLTSHLKEVTSMLVHPHCQWVVITCSLDGTIRQWNLITLQMEHSLTSSIGGGVAMSVINKNSFCLMSNSSIELVEFSFATQFWALSYCKMCQLSLVLREKKAPQVMARGVDGSVRLYSSDSTHVTTVLPSQHSSSVLSVAYCNDTSTLCTLTSDNELWVYSTRYNPARRMTVTTGDDYVTVDTLLSSVPPTTIRLHHKPDIVNICACGSLVLLGMIDGRVIILQSRKDHELGMIGYLQAFISPVTLLKFDKVLNTLMCASNYGDDAIYVQLWDTINWKLSATIQCDNNSSLVDCAMLENCIMTGHTNGTISLYTLHNTSSLNNHEDSEEQSDGSSVTSVQSSHSYSLYATTHSNNIIQLWSNHFVLLLEVSMAPSLYACCFLPGQACLILSLHNHLYKLLLDNVLPHSLLMLRKETEETLAGGGDTDSVIIDDFTSSPDPLQQHLAGAAAMTTSQTAAEREEQLDENSIDDDESVLSAAATETYQSPSVTPSPSIWLFPPLGPSSPTTSSGDLSCDDSTASLIVPAEESQREYNSPNKEMNHDCVIDEVSSTVNTSDFTGNLQLLTDTVRPITALQSVTDQGHQHYRGNTTKVIRTKLTEIKLQGIKMADNKHLSSRTSKRNTKKPTAINDTTKLHKNKKNNLVAKFGISSERINAKPVAMERDKPSGESVTLTPNEVSKQLKLHKLINDKHKSPGSSFVDVLDDGTSSKGGQKSPVTNVTSLKIESKTDQKISKTSVSNRSSSKTDQPSSVSNQSSSKADQKTNKISISDQPSSTADKVPSQDIAMTTDKSIISVVVNKKRSHDDSKASGTSRKSKSADTLTAVSSSSTTMGWQMDAIERANWKSCLQTKRHEEAHLRRLQRDSERRLVKSASHLKCFPTTNSKWHHSIERPRSVQTSHHGEDLILPQYQHSSFHEHKMNCSDYRLQLYEHEK